MKKTTVELLDLLFHRGVGARQPGGDFVPLQQHLLKVFSKRGIVGRMQRLSDPVEESCSDLSSFAEIVLIHTVLHQSRSAAQLGNSQTRLQSAVRALELIVFSPKLLQRSLRRNKADQKTG